MRFLSVAILACSLPAFAEAATVAVGSTQVGDTGGINAVGGTSILSSYPTYSSEVTTPASDWVWVGDVNSTDAASFEFTFDLTGYDVSTASLSGLMGVDNTVSVLLNGTLIAELPTVVGGNFNTLHSYGTSDASLFLSGLNSLTFDALDFGGPAAFRATAVVTADASGSKPPAVPLPAGAPLILGALAMLGGLGARSRRR